MRAGHHSICQVSDKPMGKRAAELFTKSRRENVIEATNRYGTKMKKVVLAVTASLGLAAAALGFAPPSGAMPSDTGSAQDTVNRLENQGFKVILNKVGTGSLDQCTTAAVRPGRDVTQTATSRVGSRDPVQVVLYTTVHVDAHC